MTTMTMMTRLRSSCLARKFIVAREHSGSGLTTHGHHRFRQMVLAGMVRRFKYVSRIRATKSIGAVIKPRMADTLALA